MQEPLHRTGPGAARDLPAKAREVERAAGPGTIRLQQLTAHGSYSRMGIQIFNQRRHGPMLDLRVWV